MKVVVTGLPKSGTTALFYTITAAMGNPATLFEPRHLNRSAARKRDLVVKTLLMPGVDQASFSEFDRRVLIVRDPRDIMVSLVLYLSGYHILWRRDADLATYVSALEQKERNPQSVPFAKLCCYAAPRGLVRFVRDRFDPLQVFLAGIGAGYFIVRYEDFVDGRTERLSDYLGFQITAPSAPDRHARVLRTGSYGGWRDWMTSSDIDEFRPLLAPYMEATSYDQSDWQLNPSPSIPSEHASGYIVRIANEHRIRRRRHPI